MSTDITVTIANAGPQGPAGTPIQVFASYALAKAASLIAVLPAFYYVPASSQNSGLNTMYFADGAGGFQRITSTTAS